MFRNKVRYYNKISLIKYKERFNFLYFQEK